MEHDDDLLLRLVTELRDVQVENLEVQRKLYEVVLSQRETLKGTTERNAELQERARLLQDRTMDMLVTQRRFMLYWLPALAIGLVFVWAWQAGWLR